MTPTEYLDPQRFPLTTRYGLSLKDQLLLDSFNHDRLRECLDLGKPLTEEDRQRWEELKEKARHRAEVQE